MSKRAALKRKSFFVDEASLKRARRALGVRTDSEAVREALKRVSENEAWWQLMKRTAGTVKPGSFGEI
jgi:Arc/MetJ family transcription regulator